VNSIINSLSSSFTLVEALAVLIGALAIFFWMRRSNQRAKKESQAPKTNEVTKP
jgi:hypothetical protein